MIPVEMIDMPSVAEFFSLVLALGGALCLLGLFYMLIGFFYIGPDFSGGMVVLRGMPGRLFGLVYLLMGLPTFAYAYGAKFAPSLPLYQALAPHINDSNRYVWLGGWIAILIALHVIIFFIKENLDSY